MVFEATGPRERGVSIKLPGHHTARKVRCLLMGLTCTAVSRCTGATLGAAFPPDKIQAIFLAISGIRIPTPFVTRRHTHRHGK